MKEKISNSPSSSKRCSNTKCWGTKPAADFTKRVMSGGRPRPPNPGENDQKQPGEEERVSEPPIGWPVIGVISRATGKLAEDTFKIYKGHEHVDEWQFHVFDRGETVQMPGTPMPGAGGSRFLGPGFGGNGPIQGVGNGPRPGRPGPGSY